LLSLLAGRASATPPADADDPTLDSAPVADQFISIDSDDLAEPPRPFIDLDEQPDMQYAQEFCTGDCWYEEWGLYGLPSGFIYRAYLAGPKESRMSTLLLDVPSDSSPMWESSLGARIGLLRLGNRNPIRPRGIQLDVEGSAQVRLDLPEDKDVRATDYRVGIPLSWGDEQRQWKLAYYHLSSHLGDEFADKNPSFPRFAQARDAIVLGHSIYLTDDVRIYGEAGWAFRHVASEAWEFQFGVDYAPRDPTGCRGAPFFAANAYLREELNFGGGVAIQGGWAWRSDTNPGLLRMGFHYYNGASTQWAFLPFHEEQIGGGVWYDF